MYLSDKKHLERNQFDFSDEIYTDVCLEAIVLAC